MILPCYACDLIQTMNLDITKLENVQEQPDKIIARCPACAEEGHDRKGNHLGIFPSGKYGCAIYPGDTEHRKQIMRIAGDRNMRSPSRIVKRISLKVHPEWKNWNRMKDA